MCDDYDGSELYNILQKHLEDGKSVLEIGSGPGFDLSFLKQHYQVTGSDLSDQFLKHCKAKFPDLSFIKLDASDLQTSKSFDCIYSNKVLGHLTEAELRNSLSQQSKALTPDGLIAHSFWIGDESHEMEGLLFTYYRQQQLIDIISGHYEILSTLSYQEFDEADSMFVVAKLKQTISI